MRAKFYKDKFRRVCYSFFEIKRKALYAVYKNTQMSKEIRAKAFFLLKTLPKNSSITRLRNRCVITNRSRAVYKKFKISRLVFRSLASQGYIIGVRKSSW